VACLHDGICRRCRKPLRYTGDPICSMCSSEEEREEKERVLAPLRKLTIEERIERIEWLLHEQSKTIHHSMLDNMRF
jgi:uncharacterized Zn finger protein (UPF0148 family)